ncbi:DNA (cytosine-5)-methyltransferase 1 [Methylohalomonas lacus]|uniref:Cytosine-specific methyltransferase n=1 Tax=Methylohalomonas lacus TaxID=398773 RepID=A0AAE3HKN3_9GAMM|nr:DNA cytosine methyltransferase [Methylohalomonas lacus]MCS3902188.1 DNA (cytosine-5)-methyltransferase 1 [Methylohalomonas lacus]
MSINFVDLFAGCGGFSLGFMLAGYRGILAIESDQMAFSTLKNNLIDSDRFGKFCWPNDLVKCKNHTLNDYFIKKYIKSIDKLRPTIDVVVGGPPCQGFSTYGKRDERDPRNQLIYRYIDFIDKIRPKVILVENTKGIASSFKANGNGRDDSTYAKKMIKRLEAIGYDCRTKIIDASEYGVPQKRIRFFILGINKKIIKKEQVHPFDDEEMLDDIRRNFLVAKGIGNKQYITAYEAISDLKENRRCKLIPCPDRARYYQVDYKGPSKNKPYQVLMHGDMEGKSPNSMALTNHSDETVKRFSELQEKYNGYGTMGIPSKDLIKLGLKKHRISVQAKNRPSPTITTLPDDILHYESPRVLTVRESARLQSFPDKFEFHGKYTTGGHLRIKQCPRYTQVGNAIPPLLAEYLALVIKKYIN